MDKIIVTPLSFIFNKSPAKPGCIAKSTPKGSKSYPQAFPKDVDNFSDFLGKDCILSSWEKGIPQIVEKEEKLGKKGEKTPCFPPLYLPKQKREKMVSSNSAEAVRPVISPK